MATMAVVQTPYKVVYAQAICVAKGTRVRIEKREDKAEWLGWLFCVAEDGQRGWISEDYLSITNDIAELKVDYDAREVDLAGGEHVEVLREEKGWAWLRKANGCEGWAPCENLAKNAKFIETLQLRRISASPQKVAALQTVFDAAPDYSWRVNGRAPSSEDAAKTCSELPPGKDYEDKFVLGIYSGNGLIGCSDVIRGYPNANTAYLGLLLFREDAQRNGNGRQAYQLIEKFIHSWPGITRLRLSVVTPNDIALPFWRKMGFVESGERKPYECGPVKGEHVLMNKDI